MNIALTYKRFTFLFLFLFAFIFAGCSKDKGTGAAAMQMPPAPVKVMTLEMKDTPYYETFIAQAEGSRAVEVRAQVTGILKTQDYQPGRFINAGDLMFTIEPDTYKAMVMQSQGALAQANSVFVESKENYDRISNLYKESTVSKKDYDSALAAYTGAKANVETAKAALTDAQIKLGYTYVTAPVSGYTSKANFSQGNLISATGLLTVMNTVDPIYVNFAIPASTLNNWRNLMTQGKMKIDNYTVELTLEDGSVYNEMGNVIFLDKRIDTATGDVQVRAEFKNPSMVVLPGQYVKAKLIGNTLLNALIVPQKAVLQLKEGPVAITVDANGKAQYKNIVLGMNIGNDFLVGSGLERGDTIVVEGLNKVVNGATVRSIPSNPQETKMDASTAPKTMQDNATGNGATAK